MRHGYDQEYDTGINSETKRNKKKMKELNDNKINNRSWDEAVYNNRKDLMKQITNLQNLFVSKNKCFKTQ